MNTGRCPDPWQGSALHPPGGTIPPGPLEKEYRKAGRQHRPAFLYSSAARGSPFLSPSCRLHRLAQKKLRTVFERQNVPNKPSGLTESGKALQSLFYALLGHSQHQPPGSLRVEYEGGPQAVHIGAH